MYLLVVGLWPADGIKEQFELSKDLTMKPIKLTENQKQNLMEWACKHGHLAVVRKLIDQEGADVGADDNLALRLASENGHLEVVRFLIDKGADVGADDNYALRWA